ncbi:hypothetical protein BDN72DRAFT_838431 [Pluteus cervinus]|uniref:Uncharacterized protein n=1 Tax=Pluteus cervinus TaxID=181527 RepID=A0ACD3AZW7_9AGAR|nr:hypothetical protein BDN72DRAFT_838431 [Pluteus cervinus]
MDSRKVLMAQDEVNSIVFNLFEHPSLDLRSIFQDFRLSSFRPVEDIPSIQSFLDECQHDIDLLDTKIKDTISTIAHLSRELSEASARMVQKVSQVRLCEYLLSTPQPGPLPQDLLEQIFLACLATNDHPSPHPNRAPLQVAAVCHRWRTIALSMPLLWNGLYINTPDDVELAKAWVSRCYQPSLSLKPNENNRISSSDLEAVLEALQSQSLSPRRIEITGLGGKLGDTINKFILERDHPELEELVLRDLHTSLSSVPRASSASLRRIYTHMPLESWRRSPPPSQLTVLWLTSKIHSNTLVIFLAYCPNLESVYVQLGGDGLRLDPEPQVSTGLTARRLSYMGFLDSYDEGGPPEELLRGFTFPSLRVVECGHKRKISTLWPEFTHSLKSIRRLTLQVPSMVPFAHLPEHATSLKELTISTKFHFVADILTCLKSMVLPSLETLYLEIAFGELSRWLAFEPQLTELGLAWTTSKSEPSDLARRSLVELVVQHRYKDSGAQRSKERHQPTPTQAPEVKQMLQSAFPNLHIRIVSAPSTSRLGHSPLSFSMHPQPFNDVGIHDVLQDDGSWTESRQPVHRCMY